MLDPELPFLLLRPAVIGDVRHLQHGRIDRGMPPDLLMFAQPDRLRCLDDQQQAVRVIGDQAEAGPLGSST